MGFMVLVSAIGAGLVWFWVDSMRARERANRLCAEACRKLGAQWLEGTVALQHLAVVRGADGWPRLRRRYGFQYSQDGFQRRDGTIIMLGGELEYFHLSGTPLE